ncbi:glutamine synthetase family protein [Ferrimicrobium acidiphilum]|uniref:glutamine synthetase family protein n=1 Tax=Ferrimicrobium acidiphilum TaxID=121039 RepID=UPI0023F2AC63|nr:glutamine synthetase family protein [Ferrimicrobium acidiphilum]
MDPSKIHEDKRRFVLHVVEERRIKFIQLWFTDVLGIPKSFQITPAELANALDEGMIFDGSAIDGFSRIQESDVIARPDPDSFTILPNQPHVARMFCDIVNLDGTPFDGCPRNVLKRTLERTRALGLTFFVSPEIEYFYLDPTTTKPLDEGSYFDLSLSDTGSEIRKETVFALEETGIAVKYSHHEDGPSQHEIDLRATDALAMADNIITARLIISRTAANAGVLATFMPKPLAGVQGSGMHLHMALFDEDENIFADPASADGLSKRAHHFIAGLLAHADEITAVTNQWVNSYKRLVPGYEAPAHIAWAHHNRSALVRVPVAPSTREENYQVEYRAPDPACNPYLAFSVILAAGLDGLTKELDLPRETNENLFTLPDSKRDALDIIPLPSSLEEALLRMEESTLVREALGDHVTEWFIRNKHAEWDRYNTRISQYELGRYLRVL